MKYHVAVTRNEYIYRIKGQPPEFIVFKEKRQGIETYVLLFNVNKEVAPRFPLQRTSVEG